MPVQVDLALETSTRSSTSASSTTSDDNDRTFDAQRPAPTADESAQWPTVSRFFAADQRPSSSTALFPTSPTPRIEPMPVAAPMATGLIVAITVSIVCGLVVAILCWKVNFFSIDLLRHASRIKGFKPSLLVVVSSTVISMPS